MKKLIILLLFLATQVSATTFLGRQVAITADDFDRYWNGSAWVYTLSPGDHLIGSYNAGWTQSGGGGRWLNITILKDATIDSASLKICSLQSNSGTTVNSKIQGEDTADATTFPATDDYTSRNKTTAVVTWNNIPAWTIDIWYQSPSIKTVIQEIVNRSDWVSGNDMVIFFQDFDGLSGSFRDIYDYGQSSTKACSLKIYYTNPDRKSVV